MPHPAFLLFKHMFGLNTINKSRKAEYNFYKFCNFYFFFKLILAKLDLFKVCMIDSFHILLIRLLLHELYTWAACIHWLVCSLDAAHVVTVIWVPTGQPA